MFDFFFYFLFESYSCIQLFDCFTISPRHSFLTQPLTHTSSHLPSIKLLVMRPRWPPGVPLPPSDGSAQLSPLSEQFHFVIINLSARLCSASLFNHLREDGRDTHTHLLKASARSLHCPPAPSLTVSSPEPLEWLHTSREAICCGNYVGSELKTSD